MLFFFSSRRRHTRLQGDWSSDVCSSDLREPGDQVAEHARGGGEAVQQEHDGPAVRPGLAVEDADAADGGGAVVDGPGAVGGFHCVRSFDDFWSRGLWTWAPRR